ncbi:MAG: flagellar motor switch protein FliM [Eubacteriales bacterium]
MPEVLSQSQIDELLNQLSSDEEPEKIKPAAKVKEYDFRSPKKLSKDQQKSILGMSEIFARHLAAHLAGILRSYCEISVVSIEEYPYFEYNNALPDTIMTGVLGIPAIKGCVLIDISNVITYALLERLLGGHASEASVVMEREFTDIELTLMERIFKKLAVFFQDAWSQIPSFEVELQQVETSSRFIKSVSMDEVVAVVVFDVTLNSVKGNISCCIPCMNIGSVLVEASDTRKLNTIDSSSPIRIKEQEDMLGNISHTRIDVVGVLGSTHITLGEAMNLQVGDVIRLDQKIGSEITITVNGNKWFAGEPGLKKNKIAVQIKRPYE